LAQLAATTLTSGLIRPAFRIDRSQINVRFGVECALAIALPLAIGLITDHPGVAVWGALGAYLANFSVIQPGYRVRVRIVLAASVVVAAATFLGAITGIESPVVFPVMAGWAFLAGLAVALGPSVAMIGVTSAVGMVIATALNASAGVALQDAAAAFGGGLSAALFAFAFHWRGERAESAALAAAYRTLSAYATGIPEGSPALPDSGPFDTLAATLAVPGVHRGRSLAAADRALAERCERLRSALAALAIARDHLRGQAPDSPEQRAIAAIDGFAEVAGTELEDIARGCATEGSSSARLSTSRLPTAEHRLERVSDIEATAAAEAVAEVRRELASARHLLASAQQPVQPPGEDPPRVSHPHITLRSLSQRPDTLDEVLLALRSNLTLQSTAFRHALRLAVTVTVATVLYRVINVTDGYWIVVAVLFIMKPDFGSTVGRGVLRIVGTVGGVTLTTLLLASLRPSPAVLALLAVAAAVPAYSLFGANYGLFTAAITCLVVCLAAFIGLPATTAVANRGLDNLIASGLAIIAVVVWPTWVATGVPGLVAACLRAQHRFGDTVLSMFVAPHPDPPVDDAAINQMVRGARLARSNAEAAVERMAAETPGIRKGHLSLDAAEGILAHTHRYGLAGLSLRLHREHSGDGQDMPELAPIREAITGCFAELASAVEAGNGARVPPPRLALPVSGTTPDVPSVQLVTAEIGAMAESIASSIAIYDDSLSPSAKE
jgi:uncharacterized membrane protein YccC